MHKNFSRNSRLFICSDLIYTLTGIFIETFLVAYFLKITDSNITKVAFYYITIYLLLGIGNVFMGRIIKKIPDKCRHILSLGIIFRALFILFIILLSFKIATYYILIAILYAISESLYWVPHEIIYIDITHKEDRKSFMAIKKILSKIINIIAPIILGTSIQLYSFSKIAIYVFILSLIQIVLSLLIKPNIKKIQKEKYNYKEFKRNITKKIKQYRFASIAYGIIESSISTLIVIITMMTFKTSFKLGILTTIFAVFSCVSLFLYNKFYNKKNAKVILFLCSFVLVFGVVGLLFDINKISLILYNFAYSITFCIFDAVYNTKKADLVNVCHLENRKEEYIGYSAISLSIGRVVGYVFMLIVSFSNNILYFKILLALVTLFAPIYAYIISLIEK